MNIYNKVATGRSVRLKGHSHRSSQARLWPDGTIYDTFTGLVHVGQSAGDAQEGRLLGNASPAHWPACDAVASAHALPPGISSSQRAGSGLACLGFGSVTAPPAQPIGPISGVSGPSWRIFAGLGSAPPALFSLKDN